MIGLLVLLGVLVIIFGGLGLLFGNAFFLAMVIVVVGGLLSGGFLYNEHPDL
jgi:hypothetical protein